MKMFCDSGNFGILFAYLYNYSTFVLAIAFFQLSVISFFHFFPKLYGLGLFQLSVNSYQLSAFFSEQLCVRLIHFLKHLKN